MNMDDLIQRHLDGMNSAAEAAELSRRLETDAAARSRYLDLAQLHAALAADESLRAPKAILRPQSASKPSWVRSVSQMAAGVVLGGLAVGTVWAYAMPKTPANEILPLADGGFESGIQRHGQGVPSEIGRWAGDPREIVTTHGSVKPHEGRRMLQFKAANSDDDVEGSKRSSSDMWQVIALPGNGVRRVQVRAWFNAETQGQARFQIMAVAGDGDARTAPELWKQNYQITAQVPAASRSTVFADRDPQTWQPVELMLQVPPTARVLVLGLQAFRQPNGFPAQFVDDVSVTISEEILP